MFLRSLWNSRRRAGGATATATATATSAATTARAGRLIYAFVAQGTTVVADHAAREGSFKEQVRAYLVGLRESQDATDGAKFSIEHKGLTLNFLLDSGYAYMVLAEKDVTQTTIFGFLDRVKTDFAGGSRGRAALLGPGSLQKEYGAKLAAHMKYVEEHPEEMDKLVCIKQLLADIKSKTQKNIEELLKRGEKIEVLQEMTVELSIAAGKFERNAEEIHRKEWWKNMKVQAFIISILVLLGLSIYLSICGGFVCK